MVTGGRGITADRARALAGAGIYGVSVSVDGVEAHHDRIRHSGSFAAATRAFDHLREAGVAIGSNINLNRIDCDDVEAVYDHLRGHGVTAWQVQLTAALGRAGDRPEMLLQPWQLVELMPRVAALKRRGFADGVLVMPGNNPYCHFRARRLAAEGRRERLVRTSAPPGRPFDHGGFEIVLEPWPEGPAAVARVG